MFDACSIITWLNNTFSSASHLLSNFFEPTFWLNLFKEYQYWIVVSGALIEGEMILILAGVAAYHGHMNVYNVIMIAFLGAVLHDNALFFLGRKMGQSFLKKNLKRLKKIERIMSCVLKYNTYFIMGFRFVYGIRTITPLVLGTSDVKFRKYSLLVSISAFLWAVIIVYFGYSSAYALETIFDDFNRYKKYLTFGVIVLGILLIGIMYYKKRQRS